MVKSVKQVLTVSIILLLIGFFPIFILGEGSHILVHDNLDSEFIYLHLLKVSGNLFVHDNSSVVPQVFNGLSINYFHSEFSFIRLLFYVLPSFWAYVINSVLIRLIGIIGMYLLITDFFSHLVIPKPFIILIALSFALLPVYSLYGLSVTGQPILLWSFLNLTANRKIYASFIIILLFPFYAHFAMTAPFLLTALFFYGIFIRLTKGKIKNIYFLGIGLLFLSFIVANYLTIENFLFNNIISHRTEVSNQLPGIIPTIKTLIIITGLGQYHSSLVLGFPILLLSFYLVFRRVGHWKNIGAIILSILVIGFMYSIYTYISVPLESGFHLLTTFKFNRFTFLLPILYYLLLIQCFSAYTRGNNVLIALTIIFCSGNMLLNEELKYNAAKILLPKKITENITTFAAFYSEELFKNVKTHIGLPQQQYRVVSLGIHPSIAQFNGFYTLDSYQNIYPLSYKQEFRKVIEGELNKNPDLKGYFDNWGSRCYLFSSELWESCFLDCSQNPEARINQLSINTEVLYKLGCRYILSAVPVLNAEAINLKLDEAFESNNSSLKIYLYKL